MTSGQQVIITTRTDVEASGAVLPITYDKFTEMAQKGDTIYIGRYLVCGADSASLYLEVMDVQGGYGGPRGLTICWIKALWAIVSSMGPAASCVTARRCIAGWGDGISGGGRRACIRHVSGTRARGPSRSMGSGRKWAGDGRIGVRLGRRHVPGSD